MNIAIVDDDKELLKVLKFTLEKQHKISTYSNLSTLVQEEYNSFDLLISDYDFGGQTLKKYLNEYKITPPVFVITGKATKEIAVDLLNLQVDYLIEKPIDINQLLEKIRIFQRDNNNSVTGFLNKIGYTFNEDLKEVTKDNCSSKLTPKELKILTVLLNSKSKEVSRETLEQSIWNSTSVAKNNLDTHILNLKRKIPEIKQMLKTNYGSGYVLVGL